MTKRSQISSFPLFLLIFAVALFSFAFGQKVIVLAEEKGPGAPSFQSPASGLPEGPPAGEISPAAGNNTIEQEEASVSPQVKSQLSQKIEGLEKKVGTMERKEKRLEIWNYLLSVLVIISICANPYFLKKFSKFKT